MPLPFQEQDRRVGILVSALVHTVGFCIQHETYGCLHRLRDLSSSLRVKKDMVFFARHATPDVRPTNGRFTGYDFSNLQRSIAPAR